MAILIKNYQKTNYINFLYPTGFEPVTYNLEGYCSSGWAKGTGLELIV
jgi:hypothetical protein